MIDLLQPFSFPPITSRMDTAPRFLLGQILITSEAEALLTAEEIETALHRHQHGDYGDIEDADKDMNDRSISRCCMVMSSYRTESGTEFWVKTHGTRSHTPILLPGERSSFRRTRPANRPADAAISAV